jgi:hypothetical protein
MSRIQTDGVHLLAHVSGDVESTTNALEQRETVNGGEVGVVGDLKVVGDLGQHGEADVGDLLVGDDSKGLTDGGQVGGGKGIEAVVVQTKRSVEGLKGRHLEGTNETESQVGGPDEVGQSNRELLVVVGESQRVRDITKLHVDFVNVAVVGDEDGIGLLDVDTLEGAESSVLNADVVGLGDLGGEADGLEVGERVPLDGLYGLELGHVDRVEAGQAVELNGAVDLLEAVGADALHVRVVGGNKVAFDRLDAVQRNVVGGASGNGDGTGEGRARAESGGIAGVLDGLGRRDGAAVRLSCGRR